MPTATRPAPSSRTTDAIAPPPVHTASGSAAAAAGIDALVDATPSSRNRVVDALRGLSILVVVLWHWVFSITHVDGAGRLTMPNPIDTVPGLWSATWVLQIMPLFFVVGGFANLAGWSATARRGGGWADFAKSRAKRLLQPLAALVVVWAVADAVIRIARPGTPSVVHWGMVVFIPLWFLGSYLAVVLIAPFTARAHRRAPAATLVALGASVALADVARFALHIGPATYLGSGLVWVFCHQLGYWWFDADVTGAPVRRRTAAAVTGAGFAMLVALTTVGGYERSMVAVRGGATSNMFPTTAAIAALAVFQFGLVLLAMGALQRLLARRRVWKATVAVNGVAMTVFCWHMTALVLALGAWRALGGTLLAQATPTWWAERPIWLLLPGLFLAALVSIFARIEAAGRR